MIIIKRFIDKVSATKGTNLVLPIDEARTLRDEIAKLITENYELLNKKVTDEPWNGKEVSYYVEKEYEPHAKAIFGKTKKMMEKYRLIILLSD